MKRLAKSVYVIILGLSLMVIGVTTILDPWFIVRLFLAVLFLATFLWAMERKDR